MKTSLLTAAMVAGLAALDIFEKRNDKWQAIISQVTRVKKERE